MLLLKRLIRWLVFLLQVNSIRGYAFNQLKFCPNATWNPNATTFADGSIVGCGSNVVVVDKNNTIYLTIGGNNRLQIWFNESQTLSKNISNGLSAPQGLFVRDNGDIFIDNGNSNGRVDKWTLNAMIGVSVMTVSGKCFGLFVDNNDTLYCSMGGSTNKIYKRSLNSTSLAATLITSSVSNPHGLYVDLNFNLYVAEYGGNRITRFAPGSSTGTAVVGSSAAAPGTFTLSGPIAVMLDGNGYFFIVEMGANRIIAQNSSGFRCIVGCSGSSGNTAYQLNTPYSFSFDTDGNIFVSDQSVCRFQKFLLERNSCESITTSTVQSTIVSTSTSKTTQLVITSSPTKMSSAETTMPLTTTYPNIISTTEVTTLSTTPYANIASTIETTESITTIYHNIAVTSRVEETTTSFSADKTTTNLTAKLTTISTRKNGTPAQYFVAPDCSVALSNSTVCNITTRPCTTLDPCQNSGACIDNSSALYGYTCSCLVGFSGEHCEVNSQLCSSNTCWHDGICQAISNITFLCNCTNAYTGDNCETQRNYCEKNTCLNGGVCQPLLSNYTCLCLGVGYSGRHCEIVEGKLAIYQAVSKSLAYVAILAISSVILFFLTMDILKYVFGIDPVQPLRKVSRPRKQMKRKHPAPMIRFTYVDAKPQNTPEQPIFIIEEYVV